MLDGQLLTIPRCKDSRNNLVRLDVRGENHVDQAAAQTSLLDGSRQSSLKLFALEAAAGVGEDWTYGVRRSAGAVARLGKPCLDG